MRKRKIQCMKQGKGASLVKGCHSHCPLPSFHSSRAACHCLIPYVPRHTGTDVGKTNEPPTSHFPFLSFFPSAIGPFLCASFLPSFVAFPFLLSLDSYPRKREMAQKGEEREGGRKPCMNTTHTRIYKRAEKRAKRQTGMN